MQLTHKLKSRFPLPLFTSTLALSLIGVLNIASAARSLKPFLYLTQIIWILLAILIAAFISAVPTRFLRMISYPFYAFCCGLLVLVLLISPVIKGSQRWIDLGFFRLQPSELAKIGILLATAKYCADFPTQKGHTLLSLLRPLNLSRPVGFLVALLGVIFVEKLQKNISFLQKPFSYKLWFLFAVLIGFAIAWLLLALRDSFRPGFTFEKIIALSDVVLIPVVLILVEPDLGTALITLSISVFIVLFSGVRLNSFLIAFFMAIVFAISAWNLLLYDYQKDRVRTFMNPTADLRGDGYHAFQSMVAVGSGQLVGKGFMGGTQTQLSFLPENHTDVAFAVWAEEWGFLGSCVLLFLFAFALLMMLQTGMLSVDPFSQYLVVGAFALVFSHMFINLGMVIGLLPMVGVPLPFISYGGSALLVQWTAVGLCIHVSLFRKVG